MHRATFHVLPPKASEKLRGFFTEAYTVCMIKIGISQVQLSDGTLLNLPTEGITVVVGPNNAGKSTFLRDINNLAQHGMSQQPQAYKVVKAVQLEKTGTIADLEAWMREHADRIPLRQDDTYYGRMNSGGQQVGLRAMPTFWNEENKLPALWPFFAHWMNAESRLASTSAGQYDPRTEVPTLPIQGLYKDEESRNKLSSKSQAVFGEPLHLQAQGSQLRMLLGSPSHGLTASGYPTEEYLAETANMPLLDEQGSGMRSFMYIMMNLMAQSYFCILLDEPEAFLHPPQARALGSSLATEVDAHTQVIVSTHSSDVLRGILNSITTSSVPLKIVRLTRTRDANSAKELNREDITRLWTDPVLKYSNVLDGLFHEAVVICESDSDCKYYSAIHDRLGVASGRFSPDNTLYTYAGSKQRIATMLSALRSVGVTVRVAVDLDILNNENNIKKLVEAAGGNWDDLKANWTIVDSHVRSLTRPLGTPNAIKDIITGKISSISDPESLKKFSDDVKQLTTEQTGWAQVKKGGKAIIPAGDATDAFSRLDADLKSLGIHVVPVGELENFVKSVPNKGPKWVEGVFAARLHEDDANHEAISYVGSLIRN